MATLVRSAVLDEPVHHYYAESSVLSADLEQPLKEKIEPRAYLKLPDDGQYQFQKAEPYNLEGILSYRSGYTQVAGHPSTKVVGFTTLATSVLEGLNVLDVVTADRVVAQISTVHPVYGQGQVPSVTFLGTRFENLRISGHKVEVKRNLDIVGPRRDDDRPYFDDKEVKKRIADQHDKITRMKGQPAWLGKEYLKARPAMNGHHELNCSLVDGLTLDGAPGSSFGHVIDLPHFGRIFLGELKITRELGNTTKRTLDKYKFHLTMVRLEMGCLAKGTGNVVALDANGSGGHH